MKKMPCLFKRDFSDKDKPVLLNQVSDGCEWVVNGEGVATRKFDGTSCTILLGRLYARYDAKINRKTGIRKSPPVGAIPCQKEADPITGHFPHWVEVKDQPEYEYHREGFNNFINQIPDSDSIEMGKYDGTYELIGPKIQANAENVSTHVLVRHGEFKIIDFPRDYNGIKEYLLNKEWEGVVFHHSDGRMCKIRKNDFK